MNRLFNSDAELQMNLFYVLAWTAIIANTIGYIANGIFYGLTRATLFTFGCALVMYAAGAAGMICHKPQIPALIILVVCNLIEFPGMYLIYGPDRLGYMILGIIGAALFLGEKWRAITAGILILLDSGIIFYRSMGAHLSFIVVEGDSPVAAMMDFVIVGISIVVMIIVLLMKHEKQQERLQELTEELREMAQMDPLTHLYNRRFLTEYIDERIKENDAKFAVALLDIDDFKEVNDNYGHLYGDETLQNFARAIQTHMDGCGIGTRFGGEEFMLVFDHADRVEIENVLSKIALDFDGFAMRTKNIHMSFSGGVEVFHEEDRIVKLFNSVDKKLYHAKHMGKKKVIYENEESACS